MRVLLVDDHAIFRQGLRALLETKDSNVEVIGEAEDGLEALALTAKKAPDLVVMDIYMPKLSGLQATKQIRERFPKTKIIILSSYADKVYVKEALKFGALGFVIKDAVFEELKVALNAVKNNKIYLSPGLLEPIVTHYMESPPVSKALKAYNNLTIREREIFKLFSHNCSRKKIAQSLQISPKTVDTHRFNIMQKLNINSETEIIEFAKILKQENS
ncbi:response regulator transcription factor [Phosphitispora fastidiosa]|uniref:response regulator transcription factor n=1 Tax=Phosphitispora fastidiosa TaxID=2837202 RepID=UPI001E4BCA74|nr:response regulator transcription factor [Phosphitispora fastidiosa]MBU7005624.1 DNA-binding NarL/FixJ family response regulator [Phosphitispora fastidiosa]